MERFRTAVIPEGETIITVKAEDNAGNVVTSTQTVKVKTEEEKAEEAKQAAEEKVTEAKAKVEETLAGITVANDVTKESIQEAIDTALAEAGITDVTVTVSDFEIEEATKDAPGSVSVTISGSIDRLPATEPEPPVHTHTYTWLITKEATETEAGEMAGSCTIYVYARNGYAKKITVKVK